MTAHPSLLFVIEQVIRHTPLGVWAVLATITLVGLRQTRDNAVSRARLMLTPIVLGSFSIWSISSAFGLHGAIMGAWLGGFAAVLAAHLATAPQRPARRQGNGNVVLRGSWIPLASMLTVFALRYAVTVTLVLHRDLSHDAVFSLSMALAYGALSGLFAGRALRTLRSVSITPKSLGLA